MGGKYRVSTASGVRSQHGKSRRRWVVVVVVAAKQFVQPSRGSSEPQVNRDEATTVYGSREQYSRSSSEQCLRVVRNRFPQEA